MKYKNAMWNNWIQELFVADYKGLVYMGKFGTMDENYLELWDRISLFGRNDIKYMWRKIEEDLFSGCVTPTIYHSDCVMIGNCMQRRKNVYGMN